MLYVILPALVCYAVAKGDEGMVAGNQAQVASDGDTQQKEGEDIQIKDGGKNDEAISDTEGDVESVKVVKELTWPFSWEVAKRGLKIGFGRSTGGKYEGGLLVGPYNEKDEEKAGYWWVESPKGRELVGPKDLVVVATEGARVSLNGKEGEVLSVDEEGLRLKVLLDGKEETAAVTEVMPAVASNLEYHIGDRVDVRDKEAEDWKTGTVNKTEPLLVKVDHWKKAFSFALVRFHQPKVKASPVVGALSEVKDFPAGARVEVRDAPEGAWRLGTVVATDNPGTWVKVDGWKAPFRWKYIRSVDIVSQVGQTDEQPEKQSAPLPSPEKGDSNEDKLKKIHSVWLKVCANANCVNAGRQSDPFCRDQYLCGNSSGCTWDELDASPCTKKLKLGDTVALAPGVHEQGSLQSGEVGLVSAIFEEDEQPYEVRGGYTDTYRFREEEIIPAWGKQVTWVDLQYQNPVLTYWKGHASFGVEAEMLEGAKVDLGIKTPAPWSIDPNPTPVPVRPPPLVRSPPATPRPTPVPPAPRAADTRPPSPAPAPASKPPPPATPRPTPTTPAGKKDGTIIRPPTRAPAPPPTPRPPPVAPKKLPQTIIVHAPENPSICGEYTQQPKPKWVRGSPLYISQNCLTGDCSLFVSHGGFWMVGKAKEDAAGNKGVWKSKEKVKGKRTPPNTMGHWEYLDGSWQESEEGFVGTPEQAKEKGLDPSGLCASKKESEPTPEPEQNTNKDPAEEEKRQDSDGSLYTKKEFFEYYKGYTEWEAASSTSTLNK